MTATTVVPSKPIHTPVTNSVVAVCCMFVAAVTVRSFLTGAGFEFGFPFVIACICAGWGGFAWRIAPMSVPLCIAGALMTVAGSLAWALQ